MRNPSVVTAAIVLLAGPVTLPAQDAAPLGKIDVAVRFGYVVFSHGAVEDDGIYLGLAGYRQIAADIYLGAEVTAATTIAGLTDEMSLTPLELNAKYARAIGSGFAVAGGAGLSYARAEFHDRRIAAPSVTSHEWLFGGQVFADVVFRAAWFALGAEVRYQLLQEFEQVPADFSNLRLGLQAGVVF